MNFGSHADRAKVVEQKGKRGIRLLVSPSFSLAGYFDQDMQIKVQLFSGYVSHKILYEATYYSKIIYINVYSRNNEPSTPL